MHNLRKIFKSKNRANNLCINILLNRLNIQKKLKPETQRKTPWLTVKKIKRRVFIQKKYFFFSLSLFFYKSGHPAEIFYSVKNNLPTCKKNFFSSTYFITAVIKKKKWVTRTIQPKHRLSLETLLEEENACSTSNVYQNKTLTPGENIIREAT